MPTVPVPVDVLSALLRCTDENAPPEECEDARAFVDGLLSRPSSKRFLVVAHEGRFLLVDTEVPVESWQSGPKSFAARSVASGYREQIRDLADALNGSAEALGAWAMANDVPGEPF
jgi:hypothetical protein